MEQEPTKRMVSKHEYVAMITEKVLYACVYFVLMLVTFLCMTAVVGCFILIVYISAPLLGLWVPWRLLHIGETAQIIALICLIIALCYAASRANAEAEWAQARAEKPIMTRPTTHANSSDLPTSDSLVRASVEPLQAQKTILLRAAMETTDKQGEQLLRATTGGQKEP